MPYIHFTEQEKALANSADIVSFLKSKGEDTKRAGREFIWDAPTGKVSIKGSQWYSQYELTGGGAVSFVQKFFGMNYPDTVRALLGYSAGTDIVRKPKTEKANNNQFLESPPKHSDMKRLYGYLLGERHIEREILSEFTHENFRIVLDLL